VCYDKPLNITKFILRDLTLVAIDVIERVVDGYAWKANQTSIAPKLRVQFIVAHYGEPFVEFDLKMLG